jgi:DAK2 domain fusion protein YloV
MDITRARELAAAALRNLERHRRRINALNVYPVPDGDTGTNLAATVRGIVSALDRCEAPTSAEVAAVMSRAALMEAKGNSGVILSQIVRGLAEVIGRHEHVDARVLAAGLRSATTRAYQGVERPVEGTMLTVVRAMAETAERPEVGTLPVDAALARVVAAGDEAVAATPGQLAVLREAGVVDAGGAGLVEIFRGLHHGLTGEPLPEAPVELDDLSEEAIHQEESRFRYCTVFLVEGEGLEAEGLRERLEPLGDSLLVVGDDALVKVHIHCDDPEEALAVGRAVGVVDAARVEIGDMHRQATERERWLEQLRAATLRPPTTTALVPVVAGEGNRRIFENDGQAALVIEGGQTMNPSVGQIHEAITAVNAESVVVLPNNGNVRLAAEKAAAESTRDVRVVPTDSIAQGVAVAFHFDPGVGPDENERAMRAALDGLATAEIARASRDATVDGIRVAEGSWLGLVDGRAVAAGDDLLGVLDAVLDRLVTDRHSVVTVLLGEGAPGRETVLERIRERHPGLEVDVLDGGQPHYPLLLSAE